MDADRIVTLDDWADLHHNLAGLHHARREYHLGVCRRRGGAPAGLTIGPPGRRRSRRGCARSKPRRPGRSRRGDGAARARPCRATERHYGPNHYEVAVVLSNLSVLRQHSEPKQAAHDLTRALAIKQATLRRRHPEVVRLIARGQHVPADRSSNRVNRDTTHADRRDLASSEDPSGGVRAGLLHVDVRDLDGVVAVAEPVPRRDLWLHVAGGVGCSGPQGVAADVGRLPVEGPVLPVVGAGGRQRVGRGAIRLRR